MRPKIDVFVNILGSLATLLTNSTLGLAEVGRVVAVTQYASMLLQNISVGVDKLKEVDEELKRLVREGRGPTSEEWRPWEERLANVDARFARLRDAEDQTPSV